MLSEILKFVIPIVVAILSWWVVHGLNASRDRKNKHRELRLEYLLAAYRRLESASNRDRISDQQKLDFESAIAEIHLIGTADQIDAAKAFAAAFAEDIEPIGKPKLNVLLEILRRDLRAELKLSIDPELRFFRFV